MKKIKTLRNIWITCRLIHKNPGLIDIVKGIFDFIQKVDKEKKPMSCKIALIDMKNEKNVRDIVSLWAASGESNPINRATALKNQTDELKRLLQLSMDNNLTTVDRNHAELVLKTFE